MAEAPTADGAPFGPGVVNMDGSPPMVSGAPLMPDPVTMCRAAAQYLRQLDGATTPAGGVFAVGSFADRLEQLGLDVEGTFKVLRAQLAEARDADPRRRAKAWLDRLTYDAETKAFEAAGKVRDWYRERHGDDRWDDY